MTLQEREALGIDENAFKQEMQFRRSQRTSSFQERQVQENPDGIWEVVLCHQEPYEHSYDTSAGTFEDLDEAVVLCEKFDEAYAIAELLMDGRGTPHFMWTSIKYRPKAKPVGDICTLFTVNTSRANASANREIDSIDVVFYTGDMLDRYISEDKVMAALVADPTKAFLTDYNYHDIENDVIPSSVFHATAPASTADHTAEEMLLKALFEKGNNFDPNEPVDTEIIETFITFSPKNIVLHNPASVPNLDYRNIMKQFARK